MAEIVAVDGCGVLEGGVADVDVAVFDKTGKCSFVHLGPVLVWHWSNGHCGLIGQCSVAGCSEFLWLLATTVKVA